MPALHRVATAYAARGRPHERGGEAGENAEVGVKLHLLDPSDADRPESPRPIHRPRLGPVSELLPNARWPRSSGSHRACSAPTHRRLQTTRTRSRKSAGWLP